jgi:hypothetical protein
MTDWKLMKQILLATTLALIAMACWSGTFHEQQFHHRVATRNRQRQILPPHFAMNALQIS